MDSHNSGRLCGVLAFVLAGVCGGAGSQPADSLPQTRTELIGKRSQIEPRVDLFGAKSWAPSPDKAKRAAPEVIVPPAPPKLPFNYGGSGVVNDKAVLFLEWQDRSVMVHVGDMVDGAYRVEAVEHNRAVLRYLPLDVAQVMVFDSSGVAEPTVAAKPPAADGPLFLNVPGELPLGRELPVALGIPPGSAAAKATIEITYDADALSVSGAKILRAGRALVEVNAQTPTPSKHVHLKAIAEEAIQTEIGIKVFAVDAQGKSVEVRGIPAQHIISLGSAN